MSITLRLCIIGSFLIHWLLHDSFLGKQVFVKDGLKPALITNENYIHNMYKFGDDFSLNVDLVNAFLSSLDNQINIFPSEGYYYFEIKHRGVQYSGNIAFSPDPNDKSFISYNFDCNRSDLYCSPQNGTLGEEEGLILIWLDAKTAIMTFGKKSIRVDFIDPNNFVNPPEKLGDDEIYVGTSFDESGLIFYLVYQTGEQHLFWQVATEHLLELENLHQNIIQKDVRTEFVFFEDKMYNRRLLIGVNGRHVENNSWFDGPFDQIPEREIIFRNLDFASMLAHSQNIDQKAIDQVGNYLRDNEYRVAVDNYQIYWTDDQIIRNYALSKSVSHNQAGLIKLLTKQRYGDIAQ